MYSVYLVGKPIGLRNVKNIKKSLEESESERKKVKGTRVKKEREALKGWQSRGGVAGVQPLGSKPPPQQLAL